jgi:glucuronoarabinoxylan endo-1,4-beta-xylanase
MDRDVVYTIEDKYVISHYELPETTTTDETPSIGDSDSTTLLGDANVDGNILVDDVLLVKKHILGISILEGQGATNADVTLDGDVLANDLLLIKKYVLGIITEF